MAKAKKADSEPKAPKSNPAVETPLKQITAKATWSGFLSAFSLMSIPVKSYKATDTDKIERHSFHSAACLNRIQQNTKVVCSGCGVEVDKDQTVKGVEVDGKVVLVCDEEMKAHQPAKDDVLEISEYVPQDAINPKYYESSEYLACSAEGTSLKQIFANFRGGLVRTNRVAIALRMAASSSSCASRKAAASERDMLLRGVTVSATGTRRSRPERSPSVSLVA